MGELLGATGVRQLHGGHQSMVFRSAPHMVVKVHDASLVDRSFLEVGVEATAEIARYMVLFDDMTARRTGAFPHFREAFLSGYRSVSGEPLSAGEVGDFIDLRVAALESWLDQPATAPVGIRTSAPEWLTTLRAFVDRYREQRHAAPPGEPER